MKQAAHPDRISQQTRPSAELTHLRCIRVLVPLGIIRQAIGLQHEALQSLVCGIEIIIYQ